MRKRNIDDDMSRRLLHQAEIAVERHAGILRLVVGAVLLAAVEFVAANIPEHEIAIIRQVEAARLTVICLTLLGLLTLVCLRCGLPIGRLSYTTATLDALLILGNLGFNLFALDIPGSYFSIFPVIWIVPIALAATALRYRPALQAYVAVLYVCGLGALILATGIVPADESPDVLAQFALGFGVPANLVRWGMIATTGGVLWVVAWRGRRLMEEAVQEITARLGLTRFLPRELAPILTDPAYSEMRTGRRQWVALMFVDLRGSTTMAEHLDPTRFAVFMSAFRRRVMDAVERHGGIIDKFIGDGALIVFGMPSPSPDDAVRALACARTLEDLVARWNVKRQFNPPVIVSIGVHYGEAFCGIVGDQRRLEFTVLGDAVNVAARLEKASKEYGVQILASDTIVRASSENQLWREVAEVSLRGRQEPLKLMTPSGVRHAELVSMHRKCGMVAR